MQRRKFLLSAVSAGALSMLQAHQLLASSSSVPQNKMVDAKPPLISSLRLLTTAPLSALKKFYNETIGLPVVSMSSNELTIQGGKSTITFIKSDTPGIRPFYHFAFNIPENKIQEAFEWQRQRTPVVHPNPKGPRDEITNFAHWNAHSIFFVDPAGNLVEYIARHTLSNAASGGFTPADILYVSEIGFIVNDVAKAGAELKNSSRLGEYRKLTDNFWPIGDEHGLLLVIGIGKEWSGNPGETNLTGIFKTSVSIETGASQKWEFSDYPYEVKQIQKS